MNGATKVRLSVTSLPIDRDNWAMRSNALLLIPLVLAAVVSSTTSAEATKIFAAKEGKVCAYCHLNPAGGGARGFRGLYYAGHKFSFTKFTEAAQAKKAGVAPGAMGPKTKPTKPYTGKG